MAEYYLISQLPSLDGIGDTMPLPITEERFEELCGRFLSKKAQKELAALTLIPPTEPQPSSSPLIKAWNEGERDLRLALAKARADKMKKPFPHDIRRLSPEQLKAAGEAAESENPMEAEKYLHRYRLAFLETLRPMDSFSEDAVYYYGLKLKLIARIRRFDTELGEAAYKNIYTSIMNGEELEAKE
ncbi:MAG: DUF2764 family protein [Clostridia bacterium]|nr:DUF2764 family protein [Clostridia bacterium]